MTDKFGKQLTAINGLIAGITTGLPAGATSIALRGTTYTQTTLLTLLGGLQAVLAAVPATDLAHTTALQVREQNEDEITAVLEALTSTIRGALGSSATGLGNYGLKPRKEPVALTSEQEVTKAAKAAATRKARGTLGKKQKSLIHGTVPTPTTPTTPTTP
jgi:hypothetical protein